MEAAPEHGEGEVTRSLNSEVYKAVRSHELMLNQATSAFEHAAIAPLLLLNGGGAVAFLTLLGAVSNPKARFSASIDWAIAAAVSWGVGLLLAALAASFGLISQRSFSKRQRIKREQLEHFLLRPELARIVAGGEPQKGWDAESDEVLDYALLYQKRYERARWLSIASFLIGVACAVVSVA
jgi:hypothetical protein